MNCRAISLSEGMLIAVLSDEPANGSRAGLVVLGGNVHTGAVGHGFS